MKNSAQAMVIGSFVADALALGVHWVYDTEEIVRNYSTVAELLPPHQKTYHPTKTGGDFTHYGDQSLHLLEHLAEIGGEFSVADYATAWHSFMTEYDGYLDRASSQTLMNMAEGKNRRGSGSQSNDLGGPARIAPLIYCYRDNLDELLSTASDYTMITHCGPGTSDGTQFLARSCFLVLQGNPPRKAFEQAMAFTFRDAELNLRLRQSLEITNQSVIEATKNFGQMCAVHAALPSAVYTVLQHESDLAQALTETVMSGGDSAARGMVVGMILSAHLGLESIPSLWRREMKSYNRILDSIAKLP